MKNQIKTILLLLVFALSGCNSDDDSVLPIINLTNEFIVNSTTTYLTPNGYFEEYISEGEVVWYGLKFIDGEYVFIDPPCPSAENLNHGVSIWLRLDHDDKLESGTYNYTDNDSDLGIIGNSEVFFDFRYIEANCLGVPDTKLNIVDGELNVKKTIQGYSISYNLTSENGTEITGTYFGELIERTVSEW
ncbi:hypothetical protein [Aquimarina spongiae]|uniref:Lipid-binding hydrolase n=1 Tax=Aquimarina spongiae TaxID=570521 RepID=A0A1M6HEN2_9FLAO|nr:hypothetical protein [Aquimarina spongiae]SHJ20667.1 hypothetical protein SAMN04488508_106246 [Aquimarina spongiae]